MQTFLTGLISVVAVGLFLGWMAYRVNDLALTIISLIAFAAVFADVVQTLRRPENGR